MQCLIALLFERRLNVGEAAERSVHSEHILKSLLYLVFECFNETSHSKKLAYRSNSTFCSLVHHVFRAVVNRKGVRTEKEKMASGGMAHALFPRYGEGAAK